MYTRHVKIHVNVSLPPESAQQADEPEQEEVEAMCYCGSVYEVDQSALECDACHEWYHLSCLEEREGMIIHEYELPYITEWYCTAEECKAKGEMKRRVFDAKDDEDDDKDSNARIISYSYNRATKREEFQVMYAGDDEKEVSIVSADTMPGSEIRRYLTYGPWQPDNDRKTRKKRKRAAGASRVKGGRLVA